MNDTEENLKEAIGHAMSIESKPEGLKAVIVGRIQRKNRIYIYLKDTNGNYWYENRFADESGNEISEYEHIFGKKRRRR